MTRRRTKSTAAARRRSRNTDAPPSLPADAADFAEIAFGVGRTLDEYDAAQELGLRCKECNCGRLYTLYTHRVWGNHIHRHRQCRHCGKRATTTIRRNLAILGSSGPQHLAARPASTRRLRRRSRATAGGRTRLTPGRVARAISAPLTLNMSGKPRHSARGAPRCRPCWRSAAVLIEVRAAGRSAPPRRRSAGVLSCRRLRDHPAEFSEVLIVPVSAAAPKCAVAPRRAVHGSTGRQLRSHDPPDAAQRKPARRGRCRAGRAGGGRPDEA